MKHTSLRTLLPPRSTVLQPVRHLLLMLLFWLGLTLGALAASPYAGVYMGTYSSTNDQGKLAVFVDNNGWTALLPFSNKPDEGGSLDEGFMVSSTGTFSWAMPGGTTVSGSISGGVLSGTFAGSDSSGTFSANLKSATGTQQAALGLYSGFATQGGTNAGALSFILAADGTFYGLEQGLVSHQYDSDGLSGTINVLNQLSFQSISGTTGTGSINPAAHTVAGTWTYPPSTTGSFTLTRTHSLAGAVCAYSLSSSSGNLSATGGSGSFTVTTGSGCPWWTLTDGWWLNVSGSGTGNGTVTYSAEPNFDNSFRTAKIVIADQTFTVTQGPKGYTWHNVFGWLFAAGSGWYHADGFGWMWFSSGQWIWSSSLQGWVAVTDPNSRAIWSTQFRWLTPSATDPYKADTTSIGPIYVGKYNTTIIPDSWVVSDRFGYIWANGDGEWFWSDGLKSWLGVTPGGGIWCVSQGRFL